MIAAFWALLAIVTIANRLFDPRGQGPQLGFASAPVILPIVSSLLWILVTPALFQLSDRVDAERVGRFARVLILLVAAIAAAVLVTVGVDIVAASILSRPRARPLGPPLGFRVVNNAMVALGVVAAGLARSYSLRYRAREAQATRLQAQLAEARLNALRQQLDPHFLFNTLNAVSALVERDPRGVRRMISRLSELLRYSIEGSTEQEVPLRQELHWLSRYLDVMQVRFQGRLDVHTSVSEEALDALVPNLILQPLVENAIKHGVGRTLDSGLIEIEAEVADGELQLRVRDSGPGAGAEAMDALPHAVEGGGVGLRNTMGRLEQLYGDAQSFALHRTAQGGAVAELRLPYHTRTDLHVAGVPATG